MGVELNWDGSVAEVVINNPASRNAISLPVMAELDDILGSLESSEARVVLLRGAGERAFISGGDLKDLSVLRDLESSRAMASRMRKLLDRIASFPLPVICALNGDAYGGGAEVAMACDFRIAAADIKLAFNQVSLAIMPAWGGIERLTLSIGRSRATYLLLTGRILEGQELWTWGIVEEVVQRNKFEQRCKEISSAISNIPVGVISGIRDIVTQAIPAVHPHLANQATTLFANTWISEEHWSAVEKHMQTRLKNKKIN